MTVYSLRKWTRLALARNPTVLIPLFVPEAAIVRIDEVGRELRANRRTRFVSRTAGRRFLGYLRDQRDRMLGRRGGRHTNRPERAAKYGFDVKFAAHLVRLGIQGVELLETGRLTLPMRDPWRTWLRDLRHGRHSREEVLEVAADYEQRLVALIPRSDLPERADHAWAEQWLVRVYRDAWRSREQVTAG